MKSFIEGGCFAEQNMTTWSGMKPLGSSHADSPGGTKTRQLSLFVHKSGLRRCYVPRGRLLQLAFKTICELRHEAMTSRLQHPICRYFSFISSLDASFFPAYLLILFCVASICFYTPKFLDPPSLFSASVLPHFLSFLGFSYV